MKQVTDPALLDQLNTPSADPAAIPMPAPESTPVPGATLALAPAQASVMGPARPPPQMVSQPGQKVTDPATLEQLNAPPGALETLDDTIRMLASGVTIGGADEIAAGINAFLGIGEGETFDDRYDSNLSKEMSRDEAIREREPGAALTAEILGGVGGAVAGGTLLSAAPGAGAVVGAVKNVPSAIKLGTIGATVGAASGALNAPPGERGSGALLGGATGALLGGVAIPLAKKGVQATIRKFMGSKIGKDIRIATKKILQALDRDEMTPDEAFRRVAELAPEGRLVDVGDNTRRLGRAVAGQPGRASKIASEALEARQQGQGSRIVEAVNRAIDPAGDFAATADDLIRIRSADARPLYEAAYAKPVKASEKLIALMRRPALEKAWKRAVAIARNEGDDIADDLFITRPDGGKIINPDAIKDMKTLDYMKRGLDDMVDTSRDPITGKIAGDVNRGVDSLRKQFIGVLDEISPDYKKARAAWAGPSRSLELMDMGKRFMRADDEVTTKMLARMTDDERLFFRVGAARELRQIIAKTPDGADAVKRIFGNLLKRRQIEMVFPNKKAFSEFHKSMMQESELYRTRAIASPGAGSQTQLRQADAADLAEDIGGAVRDMARGDTGSAARRFLKGLFGKKAEGLSPEQSEILAKALFTNDPEVNRQIIKALSVQRVLEGFDPAFSVAAAESGRLAGAAVAR